MHQSIEAHPDSPYGSTTITTTDKVAELKRELAMRARVYPWLIRKGKLTQSEADRQREILEAVLRDYEQELF